MSLQVWLPLNGDLKNYGLTNITINSNGISANTNGKIGSCIKMTATNSTDYWYDWSRQSVSFGGWIKMNAAEIQTVAAQGTYTSSTLTAGGTLFGDNAWGGMAIRWKTNDLAASNKVVNTLYVYGSARCYNSEGTNSSYINIACPATSIPFDTWTHVMMTYDVITHQYSFYINGACINTNHNVGNVPVGATNSNTRFYMNRNTWDQGNGYACAVPIYYNDVRIYNHALSPKEVREISKALVLHYKLTSPTGGIGDNLFKNGFEQEFNFSTAAGTSTRYVSKAINIETSIHDYTPGDYYTWSFDIMYTEVTDWTFGEHWIGQRYTNSGTVLQAWQGVTLRNIPLPSVTGMNNWYHFSGTVRIPTTNYPQLNNDTASMIRFSNTATTAGSLKFKLKNIKLEKGNNIETPWIPSKTDPLYSELGFDSNIEYDCGIANIYDGIKQGDIESDSSTPRNLTSSSFASGSYIGLESIPITTDTKNFTFSFWMKTPYPSRTMCLWNSRASVGGPISIFDIGNYFRLDDGAQHTFSSYQIPTNEWHYYAFTRDASTIKLYVDGELNSSIAATDFTTIGTKATIGASSVNTAVGSDNNFIGNLSDYRVYATTLSAEDILELYHTAAIVDNQNNLYAYEYVEEEAHA